MAMISKSTIMPAKQNRFFSELPSLFIEKYTALFSQYCNLTPFALNLCLLNCVYVARECKRIKNHFLKTRCEKVKTAFLYWGAFGQSNTHLRRNNMAWNIRSHKNLDWFLVPKHVHNFCCRGYI